MKTELIFKPMTIGSVIGKLLKNHFTPNNAIKAIKKRGVTESERNGEKCYWGERNIKTGRKKVEDDD